MSGTTEPTLADDVEKVLLLRLHPGTGSISSAADAAMAQGAATAAAGATLEASQYEDIPGVGVPDAAPTAPPVNRDVPYAEQVGELVTCTMGNWNGEPTSYAYQWKRDGTNIGSTGSNSYIVTGTDVGKTLTCVVTASNALGSTAAPPSNGVVVAAP